jgi:hypothetical protein
MKKYMVKRPTEKTGVWEWKTVIDETNYVDVEKFDTKELAESAKQSWAPSNGMIVEIDIPDITE